MVTCTQVTFRSLSRLKEDVGFEFTLKMLNDPKHHYVSRFAADALGEFGREEAVESLLKLFAKNTKTIDTIYRDSGSDLASGGQDSINDTTFLVMGAITRLPLSEENIALLRKHLGVVVNNIPIFNDNLFTFQQDVGAIYAHDMFLRAGRLEMVAEYALATALKQPLPEMDFSEHCLGVLKRRGQSGLICLGLVLNQKYASRLHQIMDVRDDSSRIMALKALMLMNDPDAADHAANILAESKTEAEYGFNPTWRMDEYNDPWIRWRAEYARALGFIGNETHIPLLVKLMNDERNVQEVRFRAAQSLGRLGIEKGLNALKIAAVSHDLHSVKTYARDYLRRNNVSWEQFVDDPVKPLTPEIVERKADEMPEALVYIEGDMVIPGYAFMDPWRQVHGFTDSGPTYRAGRNLKILSPVAPDGEVRDLTNFKDGWVEGAKFLSTERGFYFHIVLAIILGGISMKLTSMERFAPNHESYRIMTLCRHICLMEKLCSARRASAIVMSITATQQLVCT